MDYLGGLVTLVIGLLAPIVGYTMFKIRKKEQEVTELKVKVAVLDTKVENIAEDVREIKVLVNKIIDKI